MTIFEFCTLKWFKIVILFKVLSDLDKKNKKNKTSFPSYWIKI